MSSTWFNKHSKLEIEVHKLEVRKIGFFKKLKSKGYMKCCLLILEDFRLTEISEWWDNEPQNKSVPTKS